MIGTFIKTSPYTYMAGVAILLASHGYVYFKGRESGLEKYHEYRTAVESEMESVRAENAQKLAAMEQVARTAESGWESARTALANRPVRVRDNCGAGGLSALPQATGVVEGLQASQSGLGSIRTITVEECETRINGSLTDAVWIETVKKLTDDLHEASK
jgi:hypothetical protein